jgi:hypothetical protein
MKGKTLCAIVASAALLVGCGHYSDTLKSAYPEQINQQDKVAAQNTLRGKPISVAYDFGGYGNSAEIATVIDVSGQQVLAYGRLSDKNSIEAAALIQSEMNDGDNEPIELVGKYEGARFVIESLKANNYQIDF